MDMHLQVCGLEPAFQEKEKVIVGELINVNFVTSLTLEEFEELKKHRSSVWGVDVELKNPKK